MALCVLALTLGIVLQFVGSVSGSGQSEQDAAFKQMMPMTARACNIMSMGVYKTIAPEHDNIVLSPFSMCSLMAVCLHGARGLTYQQLKLAMLLKLTYRKEVAGIYSSVFKSLVEDENVDVMTSNVMSVNQGVQLLQEAKTNFQKYNGTLRIVEPEADDVLASPLSLSNTLKLSARWKEGFHVVEDVEDNLFVGTSVMYRRGEYRWQQSDHFRCDVIEIPYEGERFALYILLPFEKNGLEEMEKKLKKKDRIRLEEMFYSMEEARTTDVYLPKFSNNQSTSLKQTLIANKITKLFDSKLANLSALVEGNRAFIQEITQESSISVQEEGTMDGTSKPVAGPSQSTVPVFKATHPFLYVLRDLRTRFNIFLGKYSKSSSE